MRYAVQRDDDRGRQAIVPCSIWDANGKAIIDLTYFDTDTGQVECIVANRQEIQYVKMTHPAPLSVLFGVFDDRDLVPLERVMA